MDAKPAVIERPESRATQPRPTLDQLIALIDGHVLPALIVGISDGLILHANQAARNFYGYSLDRIRTMSIDRLAVLAPATARELLAQAGSTGLRFQTRHRGADGELRDVLVHSSRVELADRALLMSLIVDVSEQERAQRALRIGRGQLDLLLKTAVSGHLEVDFRSGTTVFSDGLKHLLGYGPDEPIKGGHTVEALIHPHDAAGVREARRRTIATGIPFERRFRLKRRDGGHVWVQGSGRALRDEAGRVVGFIGTVRDINLAVRLEADLRASEARYRMMFEASPLPMLVLDGEGRTVLEANLAAASLYGYLDSGLAQLPVSAILSDGQTERLRELLACESADGIRSALMVHRCANGRLLEVECHASVLTAEGRQTYLVLVHDMTERREAEAAIHRLVTRDMLTDLPNRASFLKHVQDALAARVPGSGTTVLMAIDIDGFRAVNDATGRAGGDTLLIETARRLSEGIRSSDLLARIGGDEFALMLTLGTRDPGVARQEAEDSATRIRDLLNAPVHVAGHDYKTTVSIGIVIGDGETRGADTLLRHAEAALATAKISNRDTWRLYDPSLQAGIDLRASLEMDLRKALDEDQFRLFYQVQVDQHGRPMGAEVLLRWIHPGRGMIPPVQFIDLAEVTGVIVPLGHWVMEQACRQLVIWAEMPGYETLRLSVNVSARQFRHAGFVDDVRRILERTGADPSRLVLELTESLLLDYADQAAQRMRQLRELGIGFSLDDFGTGYSSLAYLKDLPLDELKIDRTFTRDILASAGDAVIVRTMIGMARNLGLLLIAEGVETPEQHDALVRWGCTGFQGYLFGRPVPIESFSISPAGRGSLPDVGL